MNVLFFSVLTAFGLGFLAPTAIVPVAKSIQARSWPGVPCTVVASHVRGGRKSRIEIIFRYEVHGKTYRSDRYQFQGWATTGRSGKDEVVRRLPPGAQATGFVNPQDPLDAVMERGVTADVLYGLIPLTFVIVGLVGVARSLRAGRRQSG